ncbi:MAG TPA: hypothetical protein VHK69_20145, partial [Chitinophagaceae bacterium]|nr:hypothetical protein [Chitinophagaceae bacterium]
MSADFERQKNMQATAITGGVAGALLLLCFLLKWSLPTVAQEELAEVMEVNLGSSDAGFGSDQPMEPGDPAPAQQVAYTPPQPTPAVEEEARDVNTDDGDNDAPVIRKPVNAKPDAPKIDAETKTTRTQPTTQTAAVTPAPARPKAVLGRTVGGTGNGGNGADRYEPGGNQGIAGGTGDQGRPGGDPNGRAYSGTPRNLASRIVSIPPQSFVDDFKESGKIML